MRRLRAGLTVWVTAVFLAAGVPAQPPAESPSPFTVVLAPSATSIHWTLNTTLHTVHGTFQLKNGSFHVDPATGDCSGLIVIDATSGESGDSARDGRMHKVILESARYPEITYRPAHVSGRIDLASGGTVTVEGTFTMHGQSHSLPLTVAIQPNGTGGAKLSTSFTVPFVGWGLKDPSTFIFRTDKQVVLNVEAGFVPVAEQTPARPVLKPSEVHTAR
ncbi:MAG TPA: YceI family protein [Acidobacteriaceae bacterium]|nr:YceI family protein [Acidobacteriaceae bacterium]